MDQSIFEILQTIRKEQNITLESLSEKTRIPLRYLEALEKGDFSSIPPVYDKLFFKTYIKALEQDETKYYNEFLLLRGKTRTDKTTVIQELYKNPDTDRKPLNLKNVFLIVPAVLIVVLIIIMIKYTENVGSKKHEPIQEIDIKSVVKEMMETETRVDSTKDSLETTRNSNALQLKLSGLEKTWFRVIRDKQDTSEYTIEKGGQVTLSAINSFEFLIGRAEGISMELNGKSYLKLGEPGQVIRYLLVDSTGIVSKQIAKPRPNPEVINESQ